MILALKKSSLNLFITIVTIDWFSFKTDITVNFVQLKKSQIVFSSTRWRRWSAQGPQGWTSPAFQRSRSAGWNLILDCQFGGAVQDWFFLCFCKGWSGPSTGWIWKSKFGSTIWGDLVQCTYKRTERDQASVSIVICLNARWTMKRQLFWRDVWLHGMALVLMVASHWPNDSFVQNHHSGLILMLVDMTWFTCRHCKTNYWSWCWWTSLVPWFL